MEITIYIDQLDRAGHPPGSQQNGRTGLEPYVVRVPERLGSEQVATAGVPHGVGSSLKPW